MTGEALSRELRRGEQVESDLDAFISRRHEARVRERGERPEEDAWAESSRRQERARHNAMAREWLRYHPAKMERRERTKAVQDAEDLREIRCYQRMLGMDPERDIAPYAPALRRPGAGHGERRRARADRHDLPPPARAAGVDRIGCLRRRHFEAPRLRPRRGGG